MITAPPSPRVAIVTGAARGIGAAVATRLAADGWAVGVLDLIEESCTDTLKAIVGSGGTALAVGADVGSAEAAAAAVERVSSVLGITVNAIAPGLIQTEMTRATAERLGRSFDEFSAQRAASIPVRRPGRPEDVAGLVSYFVRDEASFVSGQVVYVAGGPKA